MITLLSSLLENPIGLLLVIILGGMLIGKIPLGFFRLGASGILIAGLVSGHFQYVLPRDIQTLGVVLFLYSVGVRAGPHIVSSFKRSKGHFFILSIVIVFSAGITAFLLRHTFGFSPDLISGLYAGALTSTPALAAAMETAGESTPSIAFGLAYPLGILAVVLMVQILPILLRVNLETEEKKYHETYGRDTIERRCYRVTNQNAVTITIEELLSQSKNRFQIPRIRRGDQIISLSPSENLELNDVVLAVGRPQDLEGLSVLLGEEVEISVPESGQAISRWLLVSSKTFVGRRVGFVELFRRYQIVVSRIRRGEIEFVPRSDFVLEAGDEIRVSGNPENLQRFSTEIGRNTRALHETDFFSFTLGLVFGVLLGLLRIPITGEFSIGLGIAGGPLVAGLIFGHVGRFGRITGHIPRAANYFVGELGLYMFLGVAGSIAGTRFLEILRIQGWILVLSGLAITLVPILTATIVARFLLKMNVLLVLGALCGGMTSTPALGVISSSSKSDIPALAYTGIYPIAVLLTTLVVQFLILL